MDSTGVRFDVFISCKREDELRVARLVRALEQHDLSVWWDRALPGGERWRENIEAALNAAGSLPAGSGRRRARQA